jgi:hypothetical protein
MIHTGGMAVFAEVAATLALALACDGESTRGGGRGDAGSGAVATGFGGAFGGGFGGADGAASTGGGRTAGAGGAVGQAGQSGAEGLGGTSGEGGVGNNGGASPGGAAGAGGGPPFAGSGSIAGNAGAAGMLPTCAIASSGEPSDYVIQGCLLDGSGTKPSTPLPPTPVTVVSVGGGDAAGCNAQTNLSTAIHLRAADAREWTYFVYVPSRPSDQIAVNDQLELTYGVGNALFFDQTVVLGRDDQLVLFTVASWHSDAPNLAAYGTSVAIGDAYCFEPRGAAPCGPTQIFPLLVTHGTTSVRLESRQTKLAGELSVSLERMSSAAMGSSCDPPTTYRYGGFTPRAP